MRPGVTRIVSLGSYWWFDETNHEYLRLPKSERPRERPEWSDGRAGALQDAVWHPYHSYTVRRGRLWILDEQGQAIASAPMP